MASTDVKTDRRYSKDHEWAKIDGTEVVFGITAYAVDQLGDITLVTLDTKVGDTIAAGKVFGTIESVKTLSDLYAPLSGKVTRVNAELDKRPELVNEDCWGKAWMIAIAPDTATPVESLLDASAYSDLLTSLS